MSGLRTLVAAMAVLTAGAAAAQDGRLTVELNKFEEEAGVCRTFFLFRNQSGMALEGFEMSLAIMDGEGVIDRLLTIDAAPLPAQRTTLKLFEVPEIGCGNISEILMHDIPVCKPQNADPIDCYPLIDLVSRTSARLVR